MSKPTTKTVVTVAAVAAGAAVGTAAGVAAVLYVRNKNQLAAQREPLRLAAAPAAEPGIAALPLGLYLTVTDYAEGTVTAQLKNESGYTMSVGQEYWLERLGAAGWEMVEPHEGICFGAESIVLADLESVTLTCDISAFEPLTAGSYKLCKTDLEASFDLELC